MPRPGARPGPGTWRRPPATCGGLPGTSCACAPARRGAFRGREGASGAPGGCRVKRLTTRLSARPCPHRRWRSRRRARRVPGSTGPAPRTLLRSPPVSTTRTTSAPATSTRARASAAEDHRARAIFPPLTARAAVRTTPPAPRHPARHRSGRPVNHHRGRRLSGHRAVPAASKCRRRWFRHALLPAWQPGRVPDGDHARGGDSRPHHHRPGDSAAQRGLLVVGAQRRLRAGYPPPGELESLVSARRRNHPDGMFQRLADPAIGTVTRHRSPRSTAPTPPEFAASSVPPSSHAHAGPRTPHLKQSGSGLNSRESPVR
jgi:hypothetical protein